MHEAASPCRESLKAPCRGFVFACSGVLQITASVSMNRRTCAELFVCINRGTQV